MKHRRIPSLILAGLLQIVPLCRSVCTNPAVVSTFAIVVRWTVGFAAYEAFDAVSSASCPIYFNSPSATTGSVGQAFSFRVTIGCYGADPGAVVSALPLPPGLTSTNFDNPTVVNGIYADIFGTPTVATNNFKANVVATFPGQTSAFSNLFITVLAAAPPGMAVTPATLNFGAVATGTTAQASFVVTNTSGSAFSGSAAVAPPYAIANGSPFALAGGTSTNVVVSFTPLTVAGFTNNVVFTSTANNITNIVTGTGAVPPLALFSANPTNGPAPLFVTFTDTSTGTITNRNWNFGDGATTNTLNTTVTHSYAVGTRTVRLIVSGPLGANTNNQVNLINSVAPPQLVINPSGLGFGSIIVGQTSNQLFSVINTGGLALTGTATVAGPFNIDGGIPYNVAPGQTGAVTVTFAPASAGNFTNNVIFAGNGGASTNQVTGTGIAPGQIAVTPGSLNFGVLVTGTTAQASFTVSNTGGASLTGNASASLPFAVVSGSPFALAGGASTNVTVSFTPLVVANFTNNVIFASTGGNSTNQTTGTGVTAGQIAVSPANLDFGLIATSTTSQQVFTVSNTGGIAVTNGTATVSAPYNIVAGATFSVPAGGSTNVTVRFAPVVAGGFTNNVVFASANGGGSTNIVTGSAADMPVANFTGTPTNGVTPLSVTFTDTSTGTITNRNWSFGDGATTNVTATSVSHTYAAGTNTVRLIVSGPVGVHTNSRANYIVANLPPPQLAVNPTSLDCGAATVGQTNSQNLFVINNGGQTLAGTASASSPYAVTSGSPFNVAPGQTGTVSVAFAPLAAGTFNANVVFASNAGNSTNALTGVGLAPGQIAVSPVGLDFGAIATGTLSQRVFTVLNGGGTPVTNGAATVTGGPFSVLSGATFSVPAGGSTNVTVQFAPVATGGFTNNVIFTTSNGGNSTNALTGTGATVPVADFTGTPTAGEAPALVSFTDASSGTISSRLWNFGDGATSAALNPSHNYTTAGSFNVSLTATGPLGSNSVTKSSYVIVTNPPVDSTPPVLIVSDPTENETFSNANITVLGTAADTNGIKGVTVNGTSALLVTTNWSAPFTLSAGTNAITVIATDNSLQMNTSTQLVHAIFAPPAPVTDTNPPAVLITFPTNGWVTAARFANVTGTALDDTGVSSVSVTNMRGGTTAAMIAGINWQAGNVSLRLGTNLLVATATDAATNSAADLVTIIRISTNYVDTTLRASKVTLTLGATANSDSVKISGIFNEAALNANFSSAEMGVMFGSFEQFLPASSLVNFKFKGAVSASNSVTGLSFKLSKHSFQLALAGLTFTNDNPFIIGLAPGAAELGPDFIGVLMPAGGVGNVSWTYGLQLPMVDQFFLGKSSLTTNSFKLTGTINVLSKPNVLTNGVTFGIGGYSETLPANGWTKGAGNVYTYTRPSVYTAPLAAMTLDFDLGRWTATGSAADLRFLTTHPTTTIYLEIGEFAAEYPAALRIKGTKFGY